MFSAIESPFEFEEPLSSLAPDKEALVRSSSLFYLTRLLLVKHEANNRWLSKVESLDVIDWLVFEKQQTERLNQENSQERKKERKKEGRKERKRFFPISISVLPFLYLSPLLLSFALVSAALNVLACKLSCCVANREDLFLNGLTLCELKRSTSGFFTRLKTKTKPKLKLESKQKVKSSKLKLLIPT